MSLARRHRERILAQMTAADPSSVEGGLALPAAANGPAAAAAEQMALRLTHDLRRLKQIQSRERKIETKRDLLPEYAAWVDGLVAGAEQAGAGTTEQVLPTIMIWRIDVGDFVGALPLAEHVLRHGIALPARYERTAGTLILEEIAEAALASLGRGDAFDLDVLERIAELTAGHDMPDEARAKLVKAIGMELQRQAETGDADAAPARAALAVAAFERAERLHARVGVEDKIKRAAKLAATATDNEETGAAG
ncbi:phage terminase small subunit [Sphingomonas jatrophae]|uniref:Phage small terminase subunit n=1 Tax=Sphingomonas jatrophae TaxID=1166337 RepID=A0A1I6JLM7_9SPHN|nr:phage terminase small subunit [Sphingomonas jatrophae]SFR79827.1 Phage small terminase subunit [Sphingomonas jatrophae]